MIGLTGLGFGVQWWITHLNMADDFSREFLARGTHVFGAWSLDLLALAYAGGPPLQAALLSDWSPLYTPRQR